MKQFLMAIIVLGLAVATVSAADTPLKAGTTLENLQAAFNGESNAHARYLAFAQQADKEGYGKAASLFRAAAKAEEIHARNHAEVIKKLGGTPEAKIETPQVKSTEENLKAAIKGETYERDVMYPAFLKVARADRNRDAIQTFNYAKTAEAEHAKLYAEALANLPQMKGAGQEYYVCTVCGYTTTKVDFAKCPSCFSPKHKYDKVS
ncbi:MAG TPA: ferritin family protein [Terriglobales bacterium]|nr:ferritin family protein [Terriglobales bacterium]